MLVRLILESEFLNREPIIGWLPQITNFGHYPKNNSMIIHFNFRHTYGWLFEKIVAELIMPNV